MGKKKSTFWADFKAFAMKGNIIDMSVGVVIGGAFGKIVSSLVDDIIMPLVGWLVGGVDFTNLKVELKGTLASNTIQTASNALESVGIDGIEEAVDGLAAAAPAADIAVTPMAEQAAQSVFLNYGNFIQQFVDFFIIALCIFLVLRAMTKLNKKKEEPAPDPAPAPKPDDVVLLEEIRDLLKNQK